MADERAWRGHMAEVVSAIEADGLLTPCELLDVIASGARVPLSVAADPLERYLRTTEAAIAEQGREVRACADVCMCAGGVQVGQFACVLVCRCAPVPLCSPP